MPCAYWSNEAVHLSGCSRPEPRVWIDADGSSVVSTLWDLRYSEQVQKSNVLWYHSVNHSPQSLNEMPTKVLNEQLKAKCQRELDSFSSSSSSYRQNAFDLSRAETRLVPLTSLERCSYLSHRCGGGGVYVNAVDSSLNELWSLCVSV